MKSIQSILFLRLLFLCLNGHTEAEPLQLDASTFQQSIESGQVHFVKFYAPWCGHCKRLAPTWDELADKLEGTVVVAKVDCTVESKLCAEQGVKGYPTLKLFSEGQVLDYRESRDIKSLVEFVQSNVPLSGTEGGLNSGTGEAEVQVDSNGLAHLTDESFDAYLTSKPGIHFIKFYAPWCGHCQRLAPTWDELATHFKSHSNVHISKVDCTQHSSSCQRNGVKGYPSLMLFQDGVMTEKYTGTRELQDMVDFVNNAAPSEQNEVIVLTSESFSEAVGKPELTFVKFYAPWCGHCKRLSPTWDQLAQQSKTTIAKVDCTVEKDLCSDEGVHGYPTLVLYQAGERKAEHRGSRDLNSLLQFIAEHQ